VDDEPQRLVVRADLDEFPQLVEWTEGFARRLELPASTSYAMQLCLEEAFSNIVRHALFGRSDKADQDKDVRLTLARHDGAVVLTIEDSAAAFDPLTVAAPTAPASIEDAVVGGQGIHLMRKFSQRMEYERRDGMNRLRLHFRV
jgi:anti-sigma regulatory factor (Ser/Thr protein kinase)